MLNQTAAFGDCYIFFYQYSFKKSNIAQTVSISPLLQNILRNFKNNRKNSYYKKNHPINKNRYPDNSNNNSLTSVPTLAW